jgi:GR25 family glycosyltransferase involved in LPS biosynthesis
MEYSNILHIILYLKRDKERKKYLDKYITPLLKNSMYIKGVDWKMHNLDTILQDHNITITDQFSDNCLKGQIACYLSHFLIWKYIIYNKIQKTIIFEDDVYIKKNYNVILNDILKKLPNDIDFLYLYIHPVKQDVKLIDEKEYRLLKSGDNWGTVAYLITLKGSEKLVKYCNIIYGPIDRQINYLIQKKYLNGIMINKSIVSTKGKIIKKMDKNNIFDSNVWNSEKYEKNMGKLSD